MASGVASVRCSWDRRRRVPADERLGPLDVLLLERSSRSPSRTRRTWSWACGSFGERSPWRCNKEDTLNRLAGCRLPVAGRRSPVAGGRSGRWVTVQPVALSRRRIAAVVAGVTVAAGLTGAVVLASDSGGSDGSTPSGGSGGQAVDDDVRTVQPGAPGRPAGAHRRGARRCRGARAHGRGHAFMQRMIAASRAGAGDDGPGQGAHRQRRTCRCSPSGSTVSQEDEIAQIERWLTDRGEAGPDTRHRRAHDPSHAGHAHRRPARPAGRRARRRRSTGSSSSS